MRQRDLACSGGRLRVLYAASSALGQFQPPRAQSDRALRDIDDLLPRRMTFSNFFHDGLQPILADMALAIDQQGRTDLDIDPVPVSRVEAFYSGDHAVSSPSSGPLARQSSPSRGLTCTSSVGLPAPVTPADRKSKRLNSSHK